MTSGDKNQCWKSHPDFIFQKSENILGEENIWKTKKKKKHKTYIYIVNMPNWLNITLTVETTWKQFWHGLLKKGTTWQMHID